MKIETDVIDNNLPLLLSKSAMQKAATKIDFKNNKVTMFGKVQDLHFTTSGHYCIPLDRKHKIINYEDQNATKVMFTNTLNNKTSQEKKCVAMKLHKQFCQARTFRLRKLLQDGGVNDEEFFKLIEEVEKTYDICCKYKRPPSKPIVCFPLSKEFNESVVMDIKYRENHLVLHLIDHATRFSSAAIIRSKRKDTIISKVFQIWIFIFGPPKQILTDNGGEFTSDDFSETGEKLNTTIKTTAAESPWSNGINERHNAIIGNMAEKIHNETKCSMDIAIASAVSSKNALANVHGYSPNQLVFGHNPNFPSVLTNKLPAMESKTSSEIVLEHLTALHCARKAFVQSEASERLNRAIKKQTRSSTSLVFQNGDSVYYKRDGSHEWKGPGKVTGTDSQTVLTKHGSIYVRVHPCRIRHENYEFSKSESDKSSRLCQTDDFSTRTISAYDKENSYMPLEFESDDETGPEEQEIPYNIQALGSSSQEGLQEFQDVSLDVHLPNTQEDAHESLNESTGETGSSSESQGESVVKFSPIVLPRMKSKVQYLSNKDDNWKTVDV